MSIKEKILTLIWKIVVILCIISLLLVGLTEEMLFFWTTVILGIAFFSLNFFAGKYIKPDKDIPAEIYELNTTEYENFIKCIDETMDYNKTDLKMLDGIFGHMFYKVQNNKHNMEISILSFVNIKEYKKKIVENILTEMNKIMIENIGDFGEEDYIDLTLVLCMEKVNSDFLKYINRNLFQTHNFIKLPVGIDMNDSKMYIHNQKKFIGKKKYMQIKDRFLKNMNNIIIRSH